jgi:hypothetical protein
MLNFMILKHAHTHTRIYIYIYMYYYRSWNIIQSDQEVSLHLMITIQTVTSNVQSVSRQSPDIY